MGNVVGIVDGYATTRFLVAELATRGVGCVHLKSSRDLPRAYTDSFDPSIYVRDLDYVGEPPVAAGMLRSESVDLVLAGAESGVTYADRLNSLLGGYGNDCATSARRTNKLAMVEAAREEGLKAPWSELASTRAEAIQAFQRHGGHPMVLKPIASAGTDGVHICNSESDVRAAADDLLGSRTFFGDTNSEIVAQEFLQGPEFMVNAVARNGLVKVVDVWREVRVPGRLGVPIVDYVDQVPATSSIARRLADYVASLSSAVEISNGAVHAEVIVTQEGPSLVEVAARPMGGFLPWVAEKYNGFSQISVLADSITNPVKFAAFDMVSDSLIMHECTRRDVWFINRLPRTGGPADWVREVEKLKSFVTLRSKVKPGEPILETVDLPSAPGFVCLAHPDPDVVLEDMHTIRLLEADGLYCAR